MQMDQALGLARRLMFEHDLTGWTVVAAAALLTVASWVAAYAVWK